MRLPRHLDAPWLHDRRTRPAGVATLCIWVAFVIFPVVDAAAAGTHGARFWLTLAATVVFSGLYLWLVLIWADLAQSIVQVAIVGVLGGLAVALTLASAPQWGFLFTYVGACGALVLASPYGFCGVIVCAVAAYATTLGGGGHASSAIGNGVSALGVGLLLSLLRELRVSNVELREARAELARTAVAAERERFARDLHDLLGHSLSVIAIKAELAGRLVSGAPDRAASEISDVESVARSALREVREAVSGYRRPTLDGELEGARVALAAAGIIAEFEHGGVRLAPEVEAVLAWAVREGATNVIRHSGATRCEVRVHAEQGLAGVEVVDDGRGPQADRAGAGSPGVATAGGLGNGLSGLRERVGDARGRLEAGAVASGGFRLAVSVPAGDGAP